MALGAFKFVALGLLRDPPPVKLLKIHHVLTESFHCPTMRDKFGMRVGLGAFPRRQRVYTRLYTV